MEIVELILQGVRGAPGVVRWSFPAGAAVIPAGPGEQLAARAAYEGTSQQDGEAQDPAWARFYPDYDALAADGRLTQAAQALWAPLEQWAHTAVRVHDHGAATATTAAGSTEASP